MQSTVKHVYLYILIEVLLFKINLTIIKPLKNEIIHMNVNELSLQN